MSLFLVSTLMGEVPQMMSSLSHRQGRSQGVWISEVSIDFGHSFMHVYALITGTFSGFESENPRNVPMRLAIICP